jgi:hypothetical protein
MMCNFAIHWKMDIIELCDIFNGKAREAAIAKMLASKRNRVIGIDGLAGSASSMLFSPFAQVQVPISHYRQ